MAREVEVPDWKELLRQWDRQQESFNPDRERRFSAMFDIVEATVGRRFQALDLGCGPGSLSQRLLGRFPSARCDAVDFDPVVLRIGREALGDQRGRLRWVDARLGRDGWTAELPHRRYDVALSTTALHWLTPRRLRSLYFDLGRMLRRGAVLLNGDHLPWTSKDRRLSHLADAVRKVRYHGRSQDSEWSAWRMWWERAERIPALRGEFELQRKRKAAHPKHEELPLDRHLIALREAGFRDAAIVWQDLENRVLVAFR